MATIRYVPNAAGIAALKGEIAPAARALEAGLADAIAARAKASAPHRTGRYSNSIRAEGNSVGTTHIAGHIIEFGGARTPAYAPLRTAASQLGLKVRDDRG